MIGRLNIFAAVLAEHRLHVARCTCLAWDADLTLDARRDRIEEQHRLHQAAALDAALAAREGERGGAEVAAAVEAISTHSAFPVNAENLRYAATHEALCRSWIFDVLTGLADRIEAQP